MSDEHGRLALKRLRHQHLGDADDPDAVHTMPLEVEVPARLGRAAL